MVRDAGVRAAIVVAFLGSAFPLCPATSAERLDPATGFEEQLRSNHQSNRPVVLASGWDGSVRYPGAQFGRKLCAWRSREGGGFGKSGSCGIGSGNPIGSSCTCRIRVGGDGNRGIYKSYDGRVIAQPRQGPPPVIR